MANARPKKKQGVTVWLVAWRYRGEPIRVTAFRSKRMAEGHVGFVSRLTELAECNTVKVSVPRAR